MLHNMSYLKHDVVVVRVQLVSIEFKTPCLLSKKIPFLVCYSRGTNTRLFNKLCSNETTFGNEVGTKIILLDAEYEEVDEEEIENDIAANDACTIAVRQCVFTGFNGLNTHRNVGKTVFSLSKMLHLAVLRFDGQLWQRGTVHLGPSADPSNQVVLTYNLSLQIRNQVHSSGTYLPRYAPAIENLNSTLGDWNEPFLESATSFAALEAPSSKATASVSVSVSPGSAANNVLCCRSKVLPILNGPSPFEEEESSLPPFYDSDYDAAGFDALLLDPLYAYPNTWININNNGTINIPASVKNNLHNKSTASAAFVVDSVEECHRSSYSDLMTLIRTPEALMHRGSRGSWDYDAAGCKVPAGAGGVDSCQSHHTQGGSGRKENDVFLKCKEAFAVYDQELQRRSWSVSRLEQSLALQSRRSAAQLSAVQAELAATELALRKERAAKLTLADVTHKGDQVLAGMLSEARDAAATSAAECRAALAQVRSLAEQLQWSRQQVEAAAEAQEAERALTQQAAAVAAEASIRRAEAEEENQRVLDDLIATKVGRWVGGW
jgi:hypothetical protein